MEKYKIIEPISDSDFIEYYKLRWLTLRKDWNEFLLIDPLDGTKEFINKNGEFTVNIALIQNAAPILGVIYSPFLSELYFAQKKLYFTL